MLFRDMNCLVCGNPPAKATLSQDEKLGMTIFYAAKGEEHEDLEVRLCDDCLAAAGRQGRVTRTVVAHRPPNVFEYIWSPDREDEPYPPPRPLGTGLP